MPSGALRLEGSQVTRWGTLTGSAELRLTILVGLVSVLTFLTAIAFRMLGGEEQESAWWTIAPAVLSALVAVGVGLWSARAKEITWTIR